MLGAGEEVMPLPFHPPTFWSKPPGSPSLAGRLLSPLGMAVGRLAEKKQRRANPDPSPIPVVSIGNLVLGGQGKTPLAIAVAERLRDQGLDVHLVCKGYGGTEKGTHRVDPDADSFLRVGDEALLLAQAAPAWVAQDRAAGVRAAHKAGAEIAVLDDAHQTTSVHKDVSLVVIDSEYGLGNGRVMPAGPLRERGESGIARATAIALIGPGPFAPETDLPVVHAKLRPVFAGMSFSAAKVFAFAGIGRPEKFFATLRGQGATLVKTVSFPDHHPYRVLTVQRMIRDAGVMGAILVTTEKDYVRLPRRLRSGITMQKVRMAFENEEALDQALSAAVELANRRKESRNSSAGE